MKTSNYNKISTPVLATLALIMFGAATINAQPGSLDASFGNGGIVTTSGNSLHYASGMAIQSDGKIVAVGEGATGSTWDFAVLRYNTNGSLDTSFGVNGKVLTSIGTSHDQARAVAILPDGKIVVAGGGCNGVGNCGGSSFFAVVRYNANGTLDTTFNGTGIVTTAFGTSCFATSVALQTDGKIVAAGYVNNGSNYDFALIRYRTDGSQDLSFFGGMVITPIGNSHDFAHSVTVQADGKIVAAGRSYNDTGGSSFAVVRYTTFGQLDTTFDGTGIVTTSFGNAHGGANELAIQWDGKIVAAGNSDNYPNPNPNSDFTLVRYHPNGKLDTSFGGTGKVIIPVGSAYDGANSVAIQPDGKIVAAGSSYTGTFSQFAAVRVNSNGSLDTTFNGTGKVITPSAFTSVSSVAIQADGKIVAAGGVPDDIYAFVLVRYQGGPFRANGKIAFTSDRDGGNSEIYVMNSDGSNQVRLTNNNVVDQMPAFSPDGRKIAYVSQITPGPPAAHIKIMNVDGTNQTEVTRVTMSFPEWSEWEPSSLSWSPDGSMIVFDDEGEIFTVNVDGTNRTNLTNNHTDDIAPTWSPDGSRILFTSHRVGYLTMHAMNKDGSDLKALPSQGYSWDVSPDWSPTGDKIVFVELSEDWFPFIKTADADGTNRQVFDGNFGGGDAVRNKPKWSPDGTKLVFHKYIYATGDCEIYVKNVNGTGLTQLTNTVGSNGQPTWQRARIRQISPAPTAETR